MDMMYLYELFWASMMQEKLRRESVQERELLTYSVFRMSLADYKAVAAAAAPELMETIEPETQVYHSILAAQAAYDLTQTDGQVVAVMQTQGADKPFAEAALVQLFNDDDTPISGKEVLMLMINPDCESMGLNKEGLTMPDAKSFIQALCDTGRFMQQAKPDTLMSRAEYIQLRNELESEED